MCTFSIINNIYINLRICYVYLYYKSIIIDYKYFLKNMFSIYNQWYNIISDETTQTLILRIT
jgi:hypothetical protein